MLGIGRRRGPTATAIEAGPAVPAPIRSRDQLDLFPPVPTRVHRLKDVLNRVVSPAARSAIVGALRGTTTGLVFALAVAPNLGVDHLTERRQTAYVRSHQDALPLKQLSPHHMRVAFGLGPYHEGLHWLASLPGFVDLARNDPQLARRLYDLSPTFDVVAQVRKIREDTPDLPTSFAIAAEKLEALAPQTRLITVPGDWGTRMLRVTSADPGTPWAPALRLSATPDADHNGFLAVQARPGPGYLFNDITLTPRDLVFISPEQLEISPKGERAKDFAEVAYFSSHGTSFGFNGISTDVAARTTAEEIIRRDAHLLPGQKAIRFVVLEACGQGDPTMMFMSTNAERFQEHLDRALDSSGHAKVTVLAPRDPGSLYANGAMSTPEGWQPATFVAPDRQRRANDPELLEAIGVVGGLAGLGLGVVGANKLRRRVKVKPSR